MSSPAEAFRAKLRESVLSPAEIERFLDDLSHEERVEAIRGTARKDQRRLYEAVDGFRPVQLVDVVAPEVPELGTVRHFGKNTLPAFTHFEKRFCRLPGEDPEQPKQLCGFNFQTLQPLTGPGYFVAVQDERRPEVLVDYRRVPDHHPDGWPAIAGNERGVARLVYGFMVDTLRRVSEHVTVGSAARNGKDLGSWFMLCREA